MTLTTIYIIGEFLIRCFVFLTLPAVFVWLNALGGLWFAFSMAPLIARTLALVAGVLLLGLTCATFIERPHSLVTILLLVIAMVASHSSTRRMLWFGLLIALWMFFLYKLLDQRVASSIWFVRSFLISLVFCLPFGLLRLLGFCFDNVLNRGFGSPIDIVTGRTLDDWFSILDRADAHRVTYAEIMAILRGYGLIYEDQRLVTVAYLRSREIPTVAISPEGMLVGNTSVGMITDTWVGLKLEKFSIGQLLFATFVVACCARIATYLQWQLPSRHELIVGGIFAIGIATLLAAQALSQLAISPHIRRTRLLMIAAIVITLVLPLVLGGKPTENILTIPGQTYYASVLFILYCIGLFYCTLHTLRHRGYRIVRNKND